MPILPLFVAVRCIVDQQEVLKKDQFRKRVLWVHLISMAAMIPSIV